MMNHDAESGRELVLDNRKLIIVFALLIATCGCFFVVGFVEGKRQGFQEGTQTASDSLAAPGDVNKPAQPDKPKTEEQPLDWYKNVHRNVDEPEITSPAPESEPARSVPELDRRDIAGEPEKKEQPAVKPVTYSVQVGAFRQKSEVELKAEMLRKKGFNCRTEPPQTPDDLYLLKVGIFKTRAEAIAMQLRLKKSGFPSFIKTNKQND